MRRHNRDCFLLQAVEATSEYRALGRAGESFPYTLPIAFIIATDVWNFVGAGGLGLFITLPLINYYEHGTYLTVAHAHAAMFGAFGLLALGIAVYVLRLAVDPDQWEGRRLRCAFWLWNVALAVLVFAWERPPGDTMLIAGMVPFAYDVLVKRFSLREVGNPDETPVSVPKQLGTDDE